MMISEDEMRQAINASVTKCWHKLVADSKQVAGGNYDVYGKDLLAHCLDEFFTKKSLEYQYQVAVVDNKLPNYIGRAMALHIKSSASTFYTKYRRTSLGYTEIKLNSNSEKDHSGLLGFEELEIDDEELKYKSPEDCMAWAVEQLNFYDKALIHKFYYDGWSKKEIAEHYDINKNSITNDIDRAKRKLKKLCIHFK